MFQTWLPSVPSTSTSTPRGRGLRPHSSHFLGIKHWLLQVAPGLALSNLTLSDQDIHKPTLPSTLYQPRPPDSLTSTIFSMCSTTRA